MIDDIDQDGGVTPEMIEELEELNARRSSMPDEDFRDAIAEILRISRGMLDKAIVIQLAGLQADVDAGLIEFEQAYRLAQGRH